MDYREADGEADGLTGSLAGGQRSGGAVRGVGDAAVAVDGSPVSWRDSTGATINTPMPVPAATVMVLGRWKFSATAALIR